MGGPLASLAVLAAVFGALASAANEGAWLRARRVGAGLCHDIMGDDME